MVERLHNGVTGRPGLTHIGLWIVLAGGTLDVLQYALPVPWTMLLDPYLGQAGWLIHPVTLLGMAMTMLPHDWSDPGAIRVLVGTLVTWRTPDPLPHAVGVVGGGSPEVDLAPGQSGTRTFTQPDQYACVCTDHTQTTQRRT